MIKKNDVLWLGPYIVKKKFEKEDTTFQSWMGVFHYQLMGLFSNPMFKKHDFFRAQVSR
jgi:hypothetical protein